MKGYNLWNYSPYRPLLWDDCDIYICRVVPAENSIHFEWLGEKTEYQIYCRVRGAEKYSLAGTATKTEFDILNLTTDNEYEFYVCCGDKKSAVRLARCGKSVGTVVNYLHPEDGAYAFSGNCLCSPSLVRHPQGHLLASMDVYDEYTPQNLTIIFRSDDDGASWHYVCELMPCFWGEMFIHKGELYMLSCSTEYGDLLIGKSTDGGYTWSTPVTLLRGSNGKSGFCGVQKNPQNIVNFNGRVYTSLDWGAWRNKDYSFAAMVMSCDENADLMIAENWRFSYPKKFDPNETKAVVKTYPQAVTIEGTLVVSPDNKLLDIMRFEVDGYAICYEVDTKNPDAPLKYSYCMPFGANFAKFMIKYDEKTKKYFTIADYLYSDKNTRNLLVLMTSDDLHNWNIVCNLLDARNEDSEKEHLKKSGFQYVDFEIEGDDIIFLCRTAVNGARSFHDSNYSTFHRIKNFRNLIV